MVPPSSPKALSGLGERGSGLSTSATPLLWVGAYPLVTLLLRLTMLAYPPRPTYLTVGRYWGDGTDWG